MNSVIRLGDFNWNEDWRMEIDIKELARDAGKKVYDEEEKRYCVDIPIGNAKKILDLILRYGDMIALQTTDEYIKQNKKLNKYWCEKRGIL